MEKKQVSIIRCEDYEPEHVGRTVRDVLEPFGGMKRFVKKGDRVLLKVNMLWAAKPEKCITTHPVVVGEVIRQVKDCGGEPFIADSPGGMPYIPATLKNAYRVCGFEDIASQFGVECNVDTSVESISLPDAFLVKRINVMKPAMEADVLINLCKAKTHGYTYITGATKNLFGLIPGLEKAGYHSKLKEPENFAKMLLDIQSCIKPALSIMDAIMGMEGDGPSAGNPRKIGAIIAGIDTNAIDVVISKIMNIEPMKVPTIRAAAGKGLISGGIDDIEIYGEDPDLLTLRDFKHPASISGGTGFEDSKLLSPFQSLFRSAFTEMFTVRPDVVPDKCIGCGICRESCPEGAILMTDKKAKIVYKKCIRCYCCHEMCPHHAIVFKQSLLNRLVRLLSH